MTCSIPKNNILHGDCIEILKEVPTESVDLVLADPPYGTTACKWDSIIPLDQMWKELHRIVKKDSAIVLCALGIFASKLKISNENRWKYDWIWKKNRPVGFVNAKLKPLKSYEMLCVFSEGKTSNGNKNNMKYNPQGLIPCSRKGTTTGNNHGENNYYRPSQDKGYTQEWTNYPTDIIQVNERGLGKKVHPTQKPVTLMEYMIETYTNESDTVLDFCAGSGTTGVACQNTNRNFILIEKEKKYIDIIHKRLKENN